ncbi:MAG TPA: AI-2E family transporter [Burkholderiaceae bacterium]|nr:AI-2E family transporter [Burkholderiaceae bacterium]
MTFTQTQRVALGWLALAAVAIGVVWLLGPVLTPFLAAAVLAYALHPAVERIGRPRGKLPRVVAVLLVELGMLAALLGVLLLMVPILSRELPMLRDQAPALAAWLNDTVAPWLEQFGIHAALDIASIKAFAVKYLNANLDDWLDAALSSARIGGSFLLAIIGNAVLLPVVLFYLLIDWASLVARVQGLIPPKHRDGTRRFIEECDGVLGQYLRGQLLVMLILAGYYAGALGLAGFQLALPVGVFTGLAVFVPYLGFGLGLALALLAGVLQFASLYGLIAVAVVYGVGQIVESVFLTPRLVGERIGLHPIAVIFALLAFGHLFGFVGVLLALPAGAVLLVALRRVRDLYLASRLYRG